MEISHPLDSSDDLNDFSLHAGDVVGFGFQVAVCTSNFECAYTQPVPYVTGDIRVAESKTAAAQLADLAIAVGNAGPGGSLAAKVGAAQQALERGDVPVVLAILDAFVKEVEAQDGKSITGPVAQSLADAAARINAALSQEGIAER